MYIFTQVDGQDCNIYSYVYIYCYIEGKRTLFYVNICNPIQIHK